MVRTMDRVYGETPAEKWLQEHIRGIQSKAEWLSTGGAVVGVDDLVDEAEAAVAAGWDRIQVSENPEASAWSAVEQANAQC